MTINELVESLQKLQAEGCGDEPVFAVSPSSGVSYGTSSVSLRQGTGFYDGPLDDHEGDYIHLTLD